MIVRVLYCVCLLFVSTVSWAAEKTIILGGPSGWEAAERRTQIDELNAVRPHPVLALSSAWTGGAAAVSGDVAAAAPNGGDRSAEAILALYATRRNFPASESALDLALSFDEGKAAAFTDSRNNYRITAAGAVQGVNERWARYGRGAALFTGEDRSTAAPLSARPGPAALFAPGRSVRDFSLEFWLYPNTIENGEQILAFTAGEHQRIFCETVRNKIRWTFQDFFVTPARLHVPQRAETEDLSDRFTLTLESRRTLLPRNWSHHLIRYNADTGLLEYLVNGRIENVIYTTAGGREGGDVYTPLIRRDGAFVLGSRFSGILDEFRVYSRVIEAPGHTALETRSRAEPELPELAKFPKSGGRVETRTIDLGESGSTLVRIDALGGCLTFAGTGGGRAAVKNAYAGKGDFRFADKSAVQFFVRAGEEPYRFDRARWIPIIPGQTVPDTIRGRYLQIAAAFYPGADCETTPYLEELRIVYNSNDPPWPPSMVAARALDGAVELSWRRSPDDHARGYLVYYGTSSGVYFGESAVLGDSPIDAGNRTSLRIEGLRNGTLYFFVIAAYDGTAAEKARERVEDLHPGKFSKEVSARPLRAAE